MRKREFKERKGPSTSADPFFRPSVQTKLAVGSPGDKFEQDADKAAAKVVNGGETEKVRASEGNTLQKAEAPVAEEEKALQKTGAPADEELQKAEAAPEEKSNEALQKAGLPAEEEAAVRKAEMPGEKTDEAIQKAAMPGEQEDTLQKAEAPAEEELQKAAMQEEEKQVRKKEAASSADPTVEAALKSRKGKGNPMEKSVRTEMESSFDAVFGDVRIHTDKEAQELARKMGAKAFTYGSDIYFNAGMYNPHSAEGKLLLAHELAHVVQQRRSAQSNQVRRQAAGERDDEH